MSFTDEQHQLLDAGPAPAAHAGQTLAQAVNFEAESFMWICQLEGFEPLPAASDVAQALWAKAHAA